MEVRSEQGMIPGPGREPFTMSMQKSPVQNQSPLQSMRLAYAPDGTAIYKPVPSPSQTPPFQPSTGSGTPAAPPSGATTVPSSGVGGGNGTSSHGLSINMGGDVVKKKRGRPRKYGPDGGMSLTLVQQQSGSGQVGVEGFSPPLASGAGKPVSSAPPDGMKKRGRPLGSTNKKQQNAPIVSGSAGIGFTPHVITVKAGEDVSSKIMSFQHGPRAICILSANGAISNVTLRQAATSGGTVTYEGRFEILSLSGSFLLSETGGQRSRTGGLSVSLAGPDGRVLGGSVAGLLTAASPVQVIIGSFVADGKKEKKKHSATSEPGSAPIKLVPGGGPLGPVSPPSRGTLSESSGGPSSPLNQSNNSSQPGFSSMAWK
ncbi:AT-hook motif nuclear-localized protein 10 [Rhynchospora pubera]|uniref:AT-hook motif nuclear-localized protein n=1 Tax=Rhynchospora pubera TaxID=906938 RepID=A0AAV8CWM9_9POAL|nr:AT-hook motif nuclear-localized protein 10 [Rhynchospora pubera]KAJ4758771.1 AT-hook motif nuclear-localized protein 10 [Rhynchospora pubera]KAJ4799599.1 AT-hook motif nuclear-localized protein 10 [Rhynchospora pubera]KAJ4811219.1 AT-hook motif nuclear-localized protein 10 [Rhynchospora pubera]